MKCEDLFGGQANRLDKSDSVQGNNILLRMEKRLYRMGVYGQVRLAVGQKAAGGKNFEVGQGEGGQGHCCVVQS
jgi:hypothetical protein